MSATRLLFRFDPERLQAELNTLPADAWIGHYNHKEYEGDWAVAPLRSVGGHPEVIYSVPIAAHQPDFYKNTSFLDKMPYINGILQRLACIIGPARLMRLGPGARILEHRDEMGLGAARDIRLHIPICTHPEVLFWVDGQALPMRPGELWYADFTKPHHVSNNSTVDRVHLVIDCKTNDWLLNHIERGHELTRIVAFLNEIGIPTQEKTLTGETFLPGILIENGRIFYDVEKMLSPGDLLHEAGHIAVAENPNQICGNVGEHDPNAMGDEIATILWSMAALRHLNIRPETVFHEQGYKGQSAWFIENYKAEKWIGLPLLEWMELCVDPKNAATSGQPPFPHMLKWMRGKVD